MRWLLVWLALSGVFLAGQLAVRLVTPGPWSFGAEDLLHLAVIPPAQVMALWALLWVRRHGRLAATPPPPARETDAHPPDAAP